MSGVPGVEGPARETEQPAPVASEAVSAVADEVPDVAQTPDVVAALEDDATAEVSIEVGSG